MTKKAKTSKVMIVGDLHFGERGNSRHWNEHLLDFLNWVVEQSHEYGVDTIVQAGDYFHQRNKIQVDTLQYGVKGAQILNDSGLAVYVLAGNHDLFYLDRLDVSSLAAIDSYVTIVDETFMVGDKLLLAPWVTDGESWDSLINMASDDIYCVGHFELNGFMVNDRYVMEHGFSPVALRAFRKVYSGHYHSRQIKDNVEYLGTPLPITMNEANEEHGVMILNIESGEETWIPYEKVKVVSIPYDQLEDFLNSSPDPHTTTIRVEFPDALEDETLIQKARNDLKEVGFDEVKIKYKGKKASELMEQTVDSVEEVDNIDEAVVRFINEASENVSGVEKDRLLQWYNVAVQKSQEVIG